MITFLLLGLLLPLAPTYAQTSNTPAVAPPFRAYYAAHEGIRILGVPVGGLQTENGYYAQYFEKGRIEDYRAEVSDPAWQLMYGRTVAELISAGVDLPVGGHSSMPTYARLSALAAPDKLQPAPKPGVDGVIAQAKADAVFIPYQPQLKSAPGHYVPLRFWRYMNRMELFPGGWLHDFGLPLTEVVTATVTKSGSDREIAFQAFERAILTYDAHNPADWQVERDNVGTDYVRSIQPSRFDAQILTAGRATMQDPAAYHIDLQLVEGDFARVRLSPLQTTTDPIWLFLKRTGQGWESLGMGTAFGPEFYDAHGLPAMLRLDSELKRSLYEALRPYVQEHAAPGMPFHLELERIAGGIAKVRAVPDTMATDHAFVYARLDDVNRWTPLNIGTYFDTEFYEQHRIPQVLWLAP